MKATPAIGAVLALTLLGGCAEEESADCCAEPLANGAISGTSLYNLESSWRDQQGRERSLADIPGNVRVLAMIFTHCEYACPRMLEDLKAIESRLEPDTDVGFVLASFDTERDGPDALAAYARANDLAPEKWQLLHGSANAVRELAAALGVMYKLTPSGGFSHSNVITIRTCCQT